MENVTSVVSLTPEQQAQYDELKAFAYWSNAGVAGFGLTGIVSDMIAYVIGVGLQGDYSAKTCIQAQAVADILQCLFLVQLGFLLTDVPFLTVIWEGVWLNDISCRLHKWYWNFTPHLSALLTALIAIDRAVALTAPIFYKQHGTTRNARRFLLPPAIGLSILTSAPYFVFNSLVAVRTCIPTGEYSFQMEVIEGTNYAYMALVPVIIVCNILMIYGIVSRKNTSGSTKSVTLALMALCFLYCVSVVAFRICQTNANAQDFSDPVESMAAEVWWALGNLALAINSVFTAPIYMMMGTMRKALITGFNKIRGGAAIEGK